MKGFNMNYSGLLKSLGGMSLVCLTYISTVTSVSVALTQEVKAQSGSKICEGKSNPRVLIEIRKDGRCSRYYYKVSDVKKANLRRPYGTYDHFQGRSRSENCRNAGKYFSNVDWDICQNMGRLGSASTKYGEKTINRRTRYYLVDPNYLYFAPTFESVGPWVKTRTCLADDGCSYSLTDAKITLNTIGFTAKSPYVDFSYSYTYGDINGGSNTQSIRYGSWGEYRHVGINRQSGNDLFPDIEFKSNTKCQSELRIDSLRKITNERSRVWHGSKNSNVTIYFGRPGCLKVKAVKHGAWCGNSTFGDPLPGLGKACYRRK